MTEKIATIVASMLKSADLFQVNSGNVWIPDLDTYAFSLQKHITRALELHGYSASASTRAYAGLLIEVPEADAVDRQQIQSIHTDAYGYTGRVTEIGAETKVRDHHIREPGNILQIPEIGWSGGSERVVIGYEGGLQLAEVYSDEIEVYRPEDTFRVDSTVSNSKEEVSLHEMAENSRVIVYKGEWNGYPQARF